MNDCLSDFWSSQLTHTEKLHNMLKMTCIYLGLNIAKFDRDANALGLS